MASDWLQVTKRRKIQHDTERNEIHKSYLERLPKEIFSLVTSYLKPTPHLRTLRLCNKFFYNEFENLFTYVYRVPFNHLKMETKNIVRFIRRQISDATKIQSVIFPPQSSNVQTVLSALPRTVQKIDFGNFTLTQTQIRQLPANLTELNCGPISLAGSIYSQCLLILKGFRMLPITIQSLSFTISDATFFNFSILSNLKKLSCIISFSLDNAKHMNNLIANAPSTLTHLCITAGHFAYGLPVKEENWKFPPNLQVLSISGIFVKKFPPLPLIKLELSDCSGFNEEFLKSIPNTLFHADFPGCDISDKEIPFLPRQLTHLGLLHVSKISDAAISDFPSNLKSLALGQTEILSRKLTKVCLTKLPSSLESLHLRNIVLSGTGAQFLPTNLKHLRLTYTHVTIEEIKQHFPKHMIECLGYSDYRLSTPDL